MSSTRPARLFAWSVTAAALALGTSCSAITKFQDPCTDNVGCREAFGVGWVCGDSGLCEEAAEEPLCPESKFYPNKPSDKDTILIASLLDNDADVDMVDAAVLAIKQTLDETAPPIPRTFALIRCGYGGDENTQVDNAKKAARYAIDDLGAVAIVGPGTSRLAEAVYQEVGDRALIISPSATSDSLTIIDGTMKSADNPGLFWRTVAPDAYQGEVIAQLISEALRTHVALVFKKGSYGEGLALQVTTSLQQLGFTGMVDQWPFQSVTGDLAGFISDIDASAAEEVIFITDSTDDVVGFLTGAAGKPGFSTKSILLSDTGYNDAVLAAATGFGDGQIRGVRPSPSEGPVYDTYKFAYKALHGRDPTAYTPETYDATWLAIHGVTWAELQEDDLTPKSMARGLHKVSAGTPANISALSWKTIGQLFEEGQTVNLVGASGELDFDDVTEETRSKIEVWSITGGAFQRVTVK